MVAWGVWTAVQLRAAAAEASRGAEVLRAVDPEDVIGDRDVVLAELATGRDALASAQRRLSSPTFAPLQVVPVVGRHLTATRTVLASADTTVDALAETLRRLDDLLVGPSPVDGRAGVDALEDVAGTVAALRDRLAAADIPDGTRLVGPLRRRVDEFRRAHERLRSVADVSAEAAGAGAGFLRGPRRCLAVAANNAEMRNGSGMPLAAAVVSTRDGRVDVGAVRSFDELTRPGPDVTVDADLQETWGFLRPGAEVRNQSLTARHDAAAAALASLWAARTGDGPVDCVVTVDVAGLAAVLAVTGPVDVDGERIDAAGVTDWVLRDQYADFADTGRPARKDASAQLASAAVGRLLSATWDPVAMLRSVRGAVERRGLMLWSADPTEQRAWVRAGIAGVPDADAVLLAVVNRGPDKLDPYLRVSARLDVAPAGARRRATLTVEVTNTATGDEPSPALGPDAGAPAAEAALYRGYLAVRVPRRWQSATVLPPAGAAAAGPDGAGQLVAAVVGVAPGATQRVVFEFSVPSRDSVVVVPSARIPAVEWSVPGSQVSAWRDERPRRVRF